MNILLIQAICLTGFLQISIRACETESKNLDTRVYAEESGVMTHGTVIDIRNNQIVVLPTGSNLSIRYTHGEGTVYVDESGIPVALDVVKSGSSVTVFYSQVEEQRMANKVIVGESRSIRDS